MLTQLSDASVVDPLGLVSRWAEEEEDLDDDWDDDDWDDEDLDADLDEDWDDDDLDEDWDEELDEEAMTA